MSDNLLARAIGGSPLTVLVRLVVVSLAVGALMSWLRIDPADLLVALERGFVHLWGTGFEALANLGRTAIAGAAVVVPVWIVIRIVSYRGRDARGGDLRRPARWVDPERLGEERRP